MSVVILPSFGDRFPYYDKVLIPTGLPEWIWSFGNFDGVHYLKIAQEGYKAEYSQVFFPLYPILIKLFVSNPIYDISSKTSYFLSAFMISNISFLLSLYLIYKLVILDYSNKVAFRSILLILAFPTAFYFGALYTESLFLLLVAFSFYFLRKKNFLLAGILAFLASSTRLVGVILAPLIFYEFLISFKRNELKNSDLAGAIAGVFLAPAGLIFYMIYLGINFNNPIYFLTAQPFFGAERSEYPIVLLPQVLFRYFKIFTSVSIDSLAFLNAFLEFLFTVIFLIFLFLSFKKIRFTYWFFSAAIIIIPTLTGTLSSMPRYVLLGFLLFPFLVTGLKNFFYPTTLILGILQIILLGLFVRGYWVA